jgi:hypothetical protein
MAATIGPPPIGVGRCQGTCQRPFFEGQVDRGEQMGLRHHELEVRQPLGADRGQLVFGLPHREGRMFHIDVILDSERHRLFLFEDLAAWRTGRLWHQAVSGRASSTQRTAHRIR